MATEKNKAIFRRFYEGGLDVMDELLDAGFVNHELPDAAGLHQGACKRAVAEARTAFPDWTTIEDLICEDEKVWALRSSSGTHAGELPGMPPTGVRIRTGGMAIVRVVGGRITDLRKRGGSHAALGQIDGAARIRQPSGRSPPRYGRVKSRHSYGGPAGARGGIVLRFQRAKRDRWLLGVCGGLARAQGWSPNVVRLVTAVLAIAIPGFSLIPVLVIYMILGAVLPESDEF